MKSFDNEIMANGALLPFKTGIVETSFKKM